MILESVVYKSVETRERPEVYSLTKMDVLNSKVAPACKLVFETSNFVNTKSSHQRVIDSKFYNHQVTVILPYNSKLPTDISTLEEQQMVNVLKEVQASQLIDKEFVEAFVKRGKLYMMSYGTKIDNDDCLAITPTGKLILNLTKDTYEELGLEGKRTQFSKNKPGKYVVNIDMMLDCFTPGRKYYDRVLWCLKDRLDLKFDLFVSWIPHDDSICPSSVAKYFESKGIDAIKVPLIKRVQWLTTVNVPVLDSSHSNRKEAVSYEELWEWLGAMACGVDMLEASADSFISTLSNPNPSVNCPRCCVLHVYGFLTPPAVHWLLKYLRSEVENTKEGSWASLTVHGFLDSPVSTGTREHGFFQEGDNTYSFLIFANMDYWLFSAFGSQDFCQ